MCHLEARAVLNSFDDRAAHYEVIDRRGNKGGEVRAYRL